MFDEFFGLSARLARFGAGFRETFASLRNRHFRIYSAGQFISMIGTWMQSIALSWMVYSMTGSALMLGIVSFATTVPVLLLSMFAGGVADRYDRKKIIVITQWLEMLQAAVLAVLTITNLLTVPLIILLAVCLGLCYAFEMPARQAYVPALVKSDELANAIGLNSALFNSTRLFGPALAGVAIAMFGVGTCFVLNAVSYIAALVSLKMLTAGSKKPADAKVNAGAVSTKDLWNALKCSGVVDIIYLTAAVSLFGFQFNNVLLPVIVGTVLHGQATQLAWLTAGVGVGALVGSLILATHGNSKLLRQAIGFATLGLSIALVALGFSSVMPLSLAAVAVAGFCLSIQFGGSNFIIQMSVPEDVRGRVMGIYSTCNVGLVPFGALLAGWMANTFGVTVALLVAAFVCAAAALNFLRSARQRSRS